MPIVHQNERRRHKWVPHQERRIQPYPTGPGKAEMCMCLSFGHLPRGPIGVKEGHWGRWAVTNHRQLVAHRQMVWAGCSTSHFSTSNKMSWVRIGLAPRRPPLFSPSGPENTTMGIFPCTRSVFPSQPNVRHPRNPGLVSNPIFLMTTLAIHTVHHFDDILYMHLPMCYHFWHNLYLMVHWSVLSSACHFLFWPNPK